MNLDEMLVLAKVVEAGSFTAAAAELGLPKSTVSRKISELEARLGSRLLQRTTRRLSLTDVGRTYYQYCARIVAEAEAAERAVSELQEVPRGPLRVTAPLNFDFLGPIVSGFLERYPEVQLELTCTDRVINLVEEGYDVGIRAGQLADSALIARRLGSAQRYLVASSAYVKRRGRPRTPHDLTGHEHLLFGAGQSRTSLRLEREGEFVDVAVTPRLIVNDVDLLYDAATAGLGVAAVPVFRCADDLTRRRLEHLLQGWQPPAAPIHAVYPSTRHLSPKMKAFLEHLQAALDPPPWERGAKG
jgi:DNA-binding transcriptional LysR family regulator